MRLPSIVRAEKLATIDKACIVRKLGALQPEDFTRLKEALKVIFKQILA